MTSTEAGVEAANRHPPPDRYDDVDLTLSVPVEVEAVVGEVVSRNYLDDGSPAASIGGSTVSDRLARRPPITAMIALPRAAIATVEPLHPAHHLLPARDQHYQREEQEAVPKHKRDHERVHRGPANTILPRADGRENAPRGTPALIERGGGVTTPPRASARATTSVAEVAARARPPG
jgi:hypothetical protein